MKPYVKFAYSFDELSPSAQDNARDYWRAHDGGENLRLSAEYLSDWYCDIFNTLGGSYDSRKAQWDVSYSGRDGAAIACHITARNVLEHLDELKTVAPGLLENIPALPKISPYLERLIRAGDITIDASGAPSHTACCPVQVTDHDIDERVDGAKHHPRAYHDCALIGEWLEDLINTAAHYFYTCLQKDYEWHQSAECIDETMRANEYEFDANGAMI